MYQIMTILVNHYIVLLVSHVGAGIVDPKK